ncbi:LysR family transcriptional regulator [Noviherbaspirillum sp.]|uniref:LysR family transcriptional regulator n=1 Tax=Noviherbaspirillum sp. TaxID=1926288 RepID=UPI002B4919CD|nr:LysR substrate-binding domain-containing protein [Noviherbaspirillum sp.]HJV82395.1 LysR substrate-binding domain-containing protein [Noviherbaspirillum sp.]
MNFKLRPLVGFVLAAHHGSFSLAASELAMTQPAFSQMIRELESVLGVQLFERTTRRVDLSEAGRELLSMVERPLDDLEDAWRYVRDIAGGKRGRIVFTTLPSVAFGIATNTLALFKAKHPEITARLIEEPDLTLVDRVLSREVDFGVGILPTQHPELAFRELFRDDLTVVVPMHHPLAKAKSVTWKELSKQSLVLLPRQSNTRHLAERGFAAAGIAVEPTYEVANMVTALSMVRAGLGITFMPRMVLRELNMSKLHAATLQSPRPERIIGVITRVDRTLSPASQAFVDMLFEEVRNTSRQEKAGARKRAA